ncbi:MAG: hypothetical protein N4A45_10280 [Flavobacteriales bacterium]|jgi:hypothetical protein|nr:hypothetical protein [Flavobacteriales bacterium]
MKQKIILKRKTDAPIFKSVAKGLYPNAVLKATVKEIDRPNVLRLHFQLFAHAVLEKVPISMQLSLDKSNIDADLENGELGFPSCNHALEFYVEVDNNGVYVTGDHGKYWLTHQDRVTLPNGLGEINLSNWEFMTNEEIESLEWKQ